MKKYEILSEIKEALIKNNLSLSSAESCTGGLISSYLTDIDGASNFIFQNFVTYSNIAKNVVLRSQTSGAQIHVMENQKPPIKVISPGKYLSIIFFVF